MAVALRECIFDPMFEKSKCVCEVTDVLLNCKRTAEKCKQIFRKWKNMRLVKGILALQT